MKPVPVDIPPSKSPRRARPEEREWLAWLVESSHDMIIGETLDGVITSWNRAAEEVYEYTAAEAIGRHVDLIVPDNRRGELEGVLARLREGERIEWFETVRRTKSGRLVEISLTVSPIRDVRGRIVGASAIARDITESRRIERELARARAAAHQYLDIAGTIFVVIGADEIVQLVNQKGCQILGWAESEILGTNWFDTFVDPDEREMLRAGFGQLMNGVHAPFEVYENAVLRRDGSRRIIAWNNALVRDADGHVTGTVSSGEDVTERRAIERALRDSERQFRHAIVDSPVPVMLHAEDGTIHEISRTWMELTGYERRQMRTIDEWLTLAFRSRAVEMRERIARLFDQRDRTYEGEFAVETALGRRRIWEFFSAPVGTDAAGRRLLMTGANDLTERRRLEREIIEVSEQERRRIGRDLHDGLASHLSGIALLSRGLANEVASGRSISAEELQEIATLAREGAEQARALAQGLSPVTLEPSGLVAALQDLARRVEHQSGISCRFVAPVEPPTLTTEVVSQLYWIAREAVTNAVKHSGARAIEIDLCRCPRSISLRVQDDGRGLPEEISGNGLGIHIMRYRANMIGARLRIDAARHRGVTVVCVIGEVDDPECRHHLERGPS